MTPAERQQLKRDRRKAGLVLVQEWVPADKAQDVRDAIDEIITPALISDETLSDIRRNASKACWKALTLACCWRMACTRCEIISRHLMSAGLSRATPLPHNR